MNAACQLAGVPELTPVSGARGAAKTHKTPGHIDSRLTQGEGGSTNLGLPLGVVDGAIFQLGMEPTPRVQKWLEPFGEGEVRRNRIWLIEYCLSEVDPIVWTTMGPN